MSKSYAMYRSDLADAAAVIAFVAANPTQFAIGTQITAANGNLCHVTAAGTALTVTQA
jgi:hypothetical protein